jgi:cell wall-associated NlpC family hydrolase
VRKILIVFVSLLLWVVPVSANAMPIDGSTHRTTNQYSNKKWESRHDVMRQRRLHRKRLHDRHKFQRKTELIVKRGISKVGSAYVWGAAGPSAFDCSGLVLWAYGGGLPHNANAQLAVVRQQGKFVTKPRNFQPGMIVFYGYGSAGHASIYIGHGRVVNALNSGTGVVTQPVSAEYVGSPIIGAGFPRWPLTR